MKHQVCKICLKEIKDNQRFFSMELREENTPQVQEDLFRKKYAQHSSSIFHEICFTDLSGNAFVEKYINPIKQKNNSYPKWEALKYNATDPAYANQIKDVYDELFGKAEIGGKDRTSSWYDEPEEPKK